MKRVITLLFLMCLCCTAMAEVPTTMQFQGYLTDNEDKPLNDDHSIAFTLYGSVDGSDSVWTETKTVTVKDGAFSVELGGSSNPIDANVIGGDSLWLGIKIGQSDELAPRTQIASVPYATRAAIAENVTGEITPSSIKVDGSTVIDGSGNWVGNNPIASGVQCAGECISSSEIDFSYAGSSSKGGAATSALTANSASGLECTDCVSASEVQFNYAGSASEGGAANSAKGLECTTCVSSTEVDFNYAGSASKGGAANSALTANSASTAATADKANDLQCSGCVSESELDFDMPRDIGVNPDLLTSEFSKSFPSTDTPFDTADVSNNSSTINVSDLGKVKSVTMDIAYSHADLSEVTITLVAPDATQLVLHNKEAGASLYGTYGKTMSPSGGSMDTFKDVEAQGNWILQILDSEVGSIGNLNNWKLNFELLSGDSITIDGNLNVNGAIKMNDKLVVTDDDERLLTTAEKQTLLATVTSVAGQKYVDNYAGVSTPTDESFSNSGTIEFDISPLGDSDSIFIRIVFTASVRFYQTNGGTPFKEQIVDFSGTVGSNYAGVIFETRQTGVDASIKDPYFGDGEFSLTAQTGTQNGTLLVSPATVVGNKLQINWTHSGKANNEYNPYAYLRVTVMATNK